MSGHRVFFKRTDARYIKDLKQRYRFRWLFFLVIGLVCGVQIAAIAVFLFPHMREVVMPALQVMKKSVVTESETMAYPGVLETLQAFPYLVMGFLTGSILTAAAIVPVWAGEELLSRRNRLLLKYYELASRAGLVDEDENTKQMIPTVPLLLSLAGAVILLVVVLFVAWRAYMLLPGLGLLICGLVLLAKSLTANDKQ